jgi:hypothetical protein
MLMGLIALGLVPWIAWTLARGIREERLPFAGRNYVSKRSRPTAYRVLIGYYLLMALLAGMICLDLLFRIDVRFWL